MDELHTGQEKIYLVKSSQRIMGPMTAADVTHMLTKRYISIIDEIRQPEGRWTYIRETPIFAEIVKKLREDIGRSIEETKETITAHTQTVSKTDWVPPHLETPTPPLPRLHISETPTEAMKDVTPVRVTGESLEAERTFGLAHDQRVIGKIESTHRKANVRLWIVTLIAATFVGYFAVRKIRPSGPSAKELTSLALRYKHIHLYDRAIDAYQKVQTLGATTPELSFEIAPLLIQSENQSLLGRRILISSLGDSSRSRDQQVEALVSVGLSFSLEEDYKMADDFYEKALAFDPQNIPGNLNRAFNSIKQGQLKKAASTLQAVPPNFTYGSHFLFSQSLIAARQFLEAPRDTNLNDLTRKIREKIQNPSPLRRELALLLVYFDLLKKDEHSFESDLKGFIEIPMKESSDFVMDPLIDRRLADWSQLDFYCNEISKQKAAGSKAKVFRATCLFEQNREAEAQRLVDESSAERPKDPHVTYIQAQMLMKAQRYQDALSLFRQPEMLTSNIAGVQHLAGWTCLQTGGASCETSQQELTSPDSENVVLQYIRAGAAMRSNQTERAWPPVKRGLELQPLYRPLIVLRDDLESLQ